MWRNKRHAAVTPTVNYGRNVVIVADCFKGKADE